MIYKHADELSKEDIRDIWRAWKDCQQPEVTTEDLIRIARGKREAIQTLDYRYKVRRHYGDDRAEYSVEPFEEGRFLMDGSKIKRSYRLGEGWDLLGSLTVVAYDGQHLRTYRQGSSDAPGHGGLEKFRSLQTFFSGRTGLLSLQMLRGAETEVSVRLVTQDLQEFAGNRFAAVVERPYTVDGRRAVLCIFGTPPLHGVWLDPERGFAVLRIVSYDVAWDERQMAVGVEADYVQTAKDFRDYGNGIWLPSKVAKYRVPPGGDPERPETLVPVKEFEVEECKVNEPVDPAEFRDIFPPGTFVSDYVQNLHYTQGEIPDLEKELGDMVDSAVAEAEHTSVLPEQPGDETQENDEPDTPGGASLGDAGDSGSQDARSSALLLVTAAAGGVLIIAAIALVAITRKMRQRP